MRISLPSFLVPPISGNYEQDQKARILHVASLAVFIGALFFAIQNLVIYPDIPSAIAFFLLAAICPVILRLNHSQRFDLAGLIFAGITFGVLDYALFEGGANLHDSGIVAYPIIILATTFFFGKRGLIASVLLTIASIAALYYLEVNQIAKAIYPSNLSRVIGLSVISIIMAAITWVVRETWERHLTRLQQSYDLTLEGWAKALEYRDGETEGHSRRVTKLCVALARELGCGEEEITDIHRGALLHDIGKMAVPDRILFKAGPLDDDEWEIMRQHPTLAVKMISEIPFLHSTLAMLKHHHEHWDGGGYPDGLKGETIPLGARIFTIVDQWDALSSDRPYRKAWKREDIIAHLRENSGKIFDPRILGIFLALVDAQDH